VNPAVRGDFWQDNIRLDIVVVLAFGHDQQGVMEIGARLAGLLLEEPDLVKTLPTDAAAQVCVQLLSGNVSQKSSVRGMQPVMYYTTTAESRTSILGRATKSSRSVSGSIMLGSLVPVTQSKPSRTMYSCGNLSLSSAHR